MSVVAEAHWGLGRLYRRFHRWDWTARHFLRSAELSKIDSTRWYEASKALRFAGLAGAEEALHRAANGGSLPPEGWYQLGRNFETKQQYGEAVSAYDEADRAGGPRGHLAFRRARCFEAMGEEERALDAFRLAANEGFDPQRSFKELARVQSTSHLLWVKLELYRDGQVFFEPQDTWTLEHARVAAKMGRHDEAEHFFAMYAEECGLDAADIALRLKSASDSSQPDRLAALLREILGAGPGRGLQIAGACQKQGMWSLAREVLLEEARIWGTSDALEYRIGHTFDREYKHAEALERFEAAFRLDPTDAYRAYKCGQSAERLRDYDLAVEWYRHALSLDHAKLYWSYRVGYCYYQLGMVEEAARALFVACGGALEDDGTSDPIETPSFALREVGKWVHDAACSPGWAVRELSAVIQLAAEASKTGLETEQVAALLRPVYVQRVGLSSKERLLAAEAYWRSGNPEQAIEVLLSSRLMRESMGVDEARYLPRKRGRASRLFAQFSTDCAVDESTVLFESYHGAQISCHPLAIFRGMRDDARFEAATFVWVTTKKTVVPRLVAEDPRVVLVERGSDAYLMMLASAGTLINNVTFPDYFVRRAGQRYLNTWHGTPMKTLGKSVRGPLLAYANVERNLIQASHLTFPNHFTKRVMLEEHDLDGILAAKTAVLGSPRLDTLVSDPGHVRAEMRRYLGVADQETLVLVAPTWRGGATDASFDHNALVEQLSSLSELPGVKVFYRAHHYTERLLRGLGLPVEAAPAWIDTSDLLTAVDHLVSDYSSIVFDFMVTGRPTTLFVPDLEAYEVERGLYSRPDELPFGVATTLPELLESVTLGESTDTPIPLESRQKYIAQETGQATEDTIEFLFGEREPDPGIESGHRPVVLFRASLIPNGVTSALVALLKELQTTDVLPVLLVDQAAIQNSPERAQVLSSIPENVRIVSRVGDTTMTPEEFMIRDTVESMQAAPSAEMRRRYGDSWRREAQRALGAMNFEAAIEWDGYATMWAGIVSHAGDARTRKLIWQHSEMVREQTQRFPGLKAVFETYDWFSGVVAVSERLAEVNRRDLGLRNDAVRAVRNTVRVEEIRDLSLEALPAHLVETCAKAEPLVVSVGRLSVEKNQLSLVRAWPEVLAAQPNAKLVIAGAGPSFSALSAEILALGVKDSVVLAGNLENPYSLMRAADLFVLPSFHEGQPIVLLEAMTVGAPVLASSCEGNLAVVEMGYGLTTGTTPEELVSGILDALSKGKNASGSFDAERYVELAREEFLSCAISDASRQSERGTE